MVMRMKDLSFADETLPLSDVIDLVRTKVAFAQQAQIAVFVRRYLGGS